MDTLLQAFGPLVVEHLIWPVVAAAIASLVGWIAARWHQLTGREMDALMRETLHSAAESAARLILARFGPGVSRLDAFPGAAELALERVQTGAPDAVRHFGLGDGRLLQLVTEKLVTLLPRP